VVGLAHGFLVTEYVEGAPVSGGEADSSLIETMARYLAFLRETFPASRRRSFDEMIEMMRINLSEGMGKGWEGPLDRLGRFRSLFEKERPAAIDGRMFPHEWFQTSAGYLKTDGVDHHDDHFFPGGQEIAWDLAGCCVEFGFSVRDEERFLGRYQALANDPRLLDRLHFYKVAYRLVRDSGRGGARSRPGCSAVRISLSALQGRPLWRTRFRFLANNVTGNTFMFLSF
jgi:hypothetical protein